MSKRWTYSQGLIYFDPLEKMSQLIKEKVPLKPDEKKWLDDVGINPFRSGILIG